MKHTERPSLDIAPIMLRTTPELRASGQLRMRNEVAQNELRNLAEFNEDKLIVNSVGGYLVMNLPNSHITVKLARG